MKQKKYPYYEQKPLYTVREYIDFLAEFTGRTAFVIHSKSGKTEIPYEKFINDIAGTAGRLAREENIGSHFAVLGENCYEWLVCCLAVMYSGNVAVPLDPASSPEELDYIVKHSDTDIIVHSDAYSGAVSSCTQKKISMKELVHTQNSDVCSFADISPDTPAAIVYTSGSAGTPKGVVLSHKNLALNAAATKMHVLSSGTTISVLPFHHTYSFTTATLSVLLNGCCIHLGIRTGRAEKAMTEIKPDFMFFIPMIIENIHKKVFDNARKQNKEKQLRFLMRISDMLLKAGIDARRRLFRDILDVFGGNLKWIGCGGAPLGEDIIKDFRSWGIEIICAYGLTECSPGVTSNRNEYNVIGSVGTPIYECRIKTAPDGEILVGGEYVMQGYYNDEQTTAEAFDGEWLKTGDLGHITDDGLLYITGRKKNLIILSNGKNVSPEELEQKLHSVCGAVREVIVYGENERITAEIYADEKDYGEIRHCVEELNRRLPQYKHIAEVKFRNTEFEKTTTKKIKRR